MISTEKGRIFIDGKETVDPLLIGYSILDAIESGLEISVKASGIESFHHKEIVYLIHDVEQKPRMITSVNVSNDCVMYEVISGIEVSTHFAFELSKEKTIY